MIRLGIIGCSEIAYRRFMPAVQEVPAVKVVAIAEEYAPEKLDAFCEEYGIERESSFDALIHRIDLDAVYIPQPPALHYKWAVAALEAGKHVFVEKPSTLSLADTKSLADLAKDKGLALHENYMFQYHSQILEIKRMIAEGAIGDVRMIRANFGFPLRAANDFRYNKALGGGALFDAAGYPIKLATVLLGDSIKVDTAMSSSIQGFEVDMYGSATLSNDEGVVCQLSYGMDNYYQCNLEVWGNKGKLTTDRIFTAPPGFEPTVVLETNDGKSEIKLNSDAHFVHSIERFADLVENESKRQNAYDEIVLQAKLLSDVRKIAGV